MDKNKNGRYVEVNGTVIWLLNDELHREGGPAIETLKGSEIWYSNGLKHREDGPAVTRPNGNKEWWVNGIECTEEEFNQWLAKKLLNDKLHITLGEKPTQKKNKI